MALSAGSRVGAYEIVDLLGVGGMGEVYRARDTKLKRDVAIKVLPEAFAHDADRLTRFQREAETLATLNHPNIAAVHGLEDSDGVAAIVMELVEGESLADRCARGPLSLEDALQVARQVADAFETAHDRGVIHRDLKPANVKVTPDGVAKVLDFGLAKMLEPDTAGRRGGASATPPAASMSPTLSVHATMQGLILGTAAYMSPEQARGKPVDRRTDIWAFGCVLFEMLTGRQVFEGGETVTDTVAAIIKNEPDWNALPADTPPHIRFLLRRCLQKDAKRRLPHIGVARIEIEEGGALDEAGPLTRGTRAGGSPATRFVPWALAGAAIAVAATLAVVVLQHREPVNLGTVRFTIDAPEGATLGTNVGQRGTGPPAPQFAVSSDGRRIAYVMYLADGKPQLWVRRLDAADGQPLRGTEDATFPFWSPDSRFVAFFAQGQLKKVDVSGGPVQVICQALAGEGGTWNRDGLIIFAPDSTTGLAKVSAAGGVSSPVTTLDADRGEASHRWPQFLPDGRHFIYLAMSGQVGAGRGRGGRGGRSAGDAANGALYVGMLDSQQRTLLRAATLRSVYADGYLLFLRDRTLMAQAFDAASLRLSGEPVPLVENVAVNAGNGRTGFAVSESGVLVYRTQIGSATQTRLAWYDRAGRRLEEIGRSDLYTSVKLSPDKKRASVYIRPSDSAQTGDLWVLDLARAGIRVRLTSTPNEEKRSHVWSPDSSHIAYAGTGAIYQVATDRVGDPEMLVKVSDPVRPLAWTPDGRSLVFNSTSPQSGIDILLLPLNGDRKPSVFLQTGFNEFDPAISRDGGWIAFTSDKGGRPAVYLRPFPSGDREWPISSDGFYPLWREDGQELFYVSQRNVMAVSFSPGTPPRIGVPVKLFEAPIFGASGQGQYDVASNGERFLIVEQTNLGSGAARSPIDVLVNWTSALQKEAR